MRSVRGSGSQEIARLTLLEDGNPVSYEMHRSPSLLKIQGKKGYAEICISSQNEIRIRVVSASLMFDVPTFRNHGVVPEGHGHWMLNLAGTFRSYRLMTLKGHLDMDAPWETKRCRHIRACLKPKDGDLGEFAIEELSWMRPPRDHSCDFNKLSSDILSDFESFSHPYLNCSDEFRQTVVDAALLNWSSIVPESGHLTRPAMFMSHNWMTNIWAWDHAFNALASSFSDQQLAWDQFMIFFDHQDKNGQIPDFFNDTSLLTTFVKPPIHGWILSLMSQHGENLSSEQACEAYEKLEKWTDWWLKFRNPDGDNLPVYWHGNDSGWDNGTAFDIPFPIKSPELASFLILQMDALSKLAGMMNRPNEARAWELRSESILEELLKTLWDGSRFKVVSTLSRESASSSDSIFNCLPIVLGDRLPQDVIDALAEQIRRHLTEFGPATEHPDSTVFERDGYWRGPIWAPPVLILVDGLERAGKVELAKDIASRFCHLCKGSGFAENFDAINGQALRDPGYTWTSSIFLILIQRYFSN